MFIVGLLAFIAYYIFVKPSTIGEVLFMCGIFLGTGYVFGFIDSRWFLKTDNAKRLENADLMDSADSSPDQLF